MRGLNAQVVQYLPLAGVIEGFHQQRHVTLDTLMMAPGLHQEEARVII